MLRAVKRTRLYKDIVVQIRELISDGELKPGDRLPAERELAKRFKVSRASLREAISALELQGLVQSCPGNGTIIIANSLDAVVQTFASNIIKEQSSLREVLEMRILLEPQVASLAASRGTSENIQQMQEILRSQESSIPGEAENVKADSDFHSFIARATQNSALIRVTVAIGEILAESRQQYLQSPERSRRSIAAHHNILNAIINHDPRAARCSMNDHILDVHHEIGGVTSEG